MVRHFLLIRRHYFFVAVSAAVTMLVCSVALAFQHQNNKTICLSVPPGNPWRTLHCKKKPPGCQQDLSGCLSPTGVYTATTFGNSYTELTYVACHFNNDPNSHCVTALPIVDCMTYDAYNPKDGNNCGKKECRLTRTIISCLGDPVDPVGDPPGSSGPPLP